MCVSLLLQSNVDEEPEEIPPPEAETVQIIPGSELIWKITPRPENSAKVREDRMWWKRGTICTSEKGKSGVIAKGMVFVLFCRLLIFAPSMTAENFVAISCSLWQFYAFSTFAMHLNELETSMEGVVPTTDSRLRPDIRAMENGDIGTVYDLDFETLLCHTSLNTPSLVVYTFLHPCPHL